MSEADKPEHLFYLNELLKAEEIIREFQIRVSNYFWRREIFT